MFYRTAVVCALLATGAGTSRAQQSGSSRLLGTAFDSTSMTPLEEATVTLIPTRRQFVADQEGRFFLSGLSPGHYRVEVRHPRLDTLGIAMLTSGLLTLSDGLTTSVDVAVPGWEGLANALCPGEGTSVVGFVVDGATGIRLPNTEVMVSPDARPDTVTSEIFLNVRNPTELDQRIEGDTLHTKTDEYGKYAVCGLAATVPWRVEAGDANAGRHAVAILSLGAVEVVHQDLSMLSAGLGGVVGRLTDDVTGDPIEGATIAITPGGPTTVSSRDGRFLFLSVSPGKRAFQVSHIAYGVLTFDIEVPGGQTVAFDARLAPDVIELERIQVVARTEMHEDNRMRGTPTRVLTRQEIDALPVQPRNVGELLRGIPGLQVNSGQVGGTVCVMGAQRIRSRVVTMPDGHGQRVSGGCDPPLVLIDGVLVGERMSGNLGDVWLGRNVDTIGELFATLSVEDIERIEYLKPSEAGIRFGTLAGHGVLLITTRQGHPR